MDNFVEFKRWKAGRAITNNKYKSQFLNHKKLKQLIIEINIYEGTADTIIKFFLTRRG